MRIDAHQHFWKYDEARDTWITDSMSLLRRDFLPEHLLPELTANEFDACIAVQADQSEQETRFLLDLASQHPQIRGVVGWLDLQAPDIVERLQSSSQCRRLVGLRHVVQSEPDDRFMLRPAFLRGIESLEAFNLTYDILIYPQQLPAALELVNRYLDQPFVVDHIAKPEIRTGRQLPWCHQIREIAQNKNVYCKVSGMITEADWKHWSPDDITPYLDVVFEAFGTSRVMFGSDWPVCLLAGTYGQVTKLVTEYTQSLPAMEKANIFGMNAARFYGV